MLDTSKQVDRVGDVTKAAPRVGHQRYRRHRQAASRRDPRRRDHVLRCYLDDGSASVTMARQRAGELTDGGGVHNSDGEDGNEKLGEEHGDVCDVSTGWLMSLKETRPRFYSCYLISCEQPGVGPAPYPIRCPLIAGLPK
jgi:hypothetical protein